MPCFDKKLEASRSDFYMPNAETREVDCVITSGTVITPIVVFVRMDSHYCLSYFFYLLKGRFWKCWRRKMCPLMIWSLLPQIQCTFFFILHFFLNLLIHSHKVIIQFHLHSSFPIHFFYHRFSSFCGDEFLSHAGSGSGGYLHHVFTHAAKHLFGEEVKNLTYKTLRWACRLFLKQQKHFTVVWCVLEQPSSKPNINEDTFCARDAHSQ